MSGVAKAAGYTGLLLAGLVAALFLWVAKPNPFALLGLAAVLVGLGMIQRRQPELKDRPFWLSWNFGFAGYFTFLAVAR